ncbi:MAG: hypothetical protein MUC88_06235 [Planctomycetes bacterium]|nr:hypothetical protein [Planctomycetota bacterium]
MGKKLVSLLCVGLGLVVLTAPTAQCMNVDVRIASGNDDAEEHLAAGDMDIGSTDLELPYEDDGTPSATDDQLTGLRFTVPVPKGAQILKAYLEFEMDETKGNTKPVNLVIEGQLTANARAITAATGDLTGRTPWTDAQVKWTVPTGLAVDAKFRSPDISAIIKEIISQNGWVAGNALMIAVRDDKSAPSTGLRCVEAYDGEPTAAPLLHLEVFNPTAHTPNPADGTLGVFMPLFTWMAGDGAMFHSVYLGKTPELTEADCVAKNQYPTMYYHVLGLEPGVQYYWRVDETDVTGKITTGPVWTFVAQADTAYYPTPANGSTDVSPSAALTWQPGLGVIKHHVYFGNSLDAVTQGAAGTDKGETPDPTFKPTALEPVTTYYWRVDEIGLGGAVKTGPVWSFTTYLPVDDFESYTDNEGGRIYETWIDGWTNNTGSTVGNTTAPFAEQTIVRSGKQSMPMDYNNARTPFYSEAEREFAATQNWTVGGLADLKLDFRGSSRNGAGALYVVVADSSGKSVVVTHADTAAVTAPVWTPWKIPLSSLTGVNLSRVKKISIGVGNRQNPAAGGTGRIYIDEIRVTKP